MKKLISIIILIILLSLISVFADESAESIDNFTAQAEPDIKSSYRFLKAYDFDFMNEGQKLGGTEDKGIDNGKKKCITTDKTPGIFYDIEAVSKDAYSGKALKFTAIDGGSGVYAPLCIDLSQNRPVTQKFSGAEEFWFYVDLTNWKEDRGIRPVIHEIDCDIAGEPLNEITVWVPDHTKPVYIQDVTNGWVTCPVTLGGVIELKSDYKGFVRIPIASLNYAGYDGNVWGNADNNHKFDGYKVTGIDLEVGCYERNNGNYIIFDQIGFVGEFTVGTNIPSELIKTNQSQSISENENSSNVQAVNESDNQFLDKSVLIIVITTIAVTVCAIITIIIILIKTKKYYVK